MKTFNKIHVVLLFILLLMGCTPDSLTKFKKEEPKKSPSTSSNSSGPIYDASGNIIDPSTFIDPTIFKYRNARIESIASVTTLNATLGVAVELAGVVDGSLADNSKVRNVFRSCSISPALPAGLSLTTTLADFCKISGTPLTVSTDLASVGSPINYTITLTYNGSNGLIKTITTPVAIGVYRTFPTLFYTLSDKLLLNVSLNSGSLKTITPNTDVDATYLSTGFLTSESGTITVVKFVDEDTSKIGVIKTVPMVVASGAITALGLAGNEYPGTSTPKFISAAGGKVAKVIRVDSTNNTLHLEMISSTPFASGDLLDDAKTFATGIAGATVTSIDLLTNFTRVNGSFNFDYNIQYFINRMTMSTTTRAYEVGKTIGVDHPQLMPILNSSNTEAYSMANGVKFTISPQLPTGLTINADTGEVTGATTDVVDPAIFTVTATNPIGSTTSSIGLSSIKTPKDLSFSTRQLIAVKNTVKFLEGEQILQPVTPPLTTSVAGRILRKFDVGAGTDENRYKLSIDSYNGIFKAAASLDSGNFFYSEKSYIPTAAIAPLVTTASTVPVNVNYNIALTVSDETNFAIGGYVSTPQGASGRIVYIDTANNIIYIQSTMTGSPVAYIPFQERNGGAANTLGNAEVYASRTATTSITQVESNNVVVIHDTVTGTPDFTEGKEITSSADIAGYVLTYNATSDAITLNDITRRPGTSIYLKNGQTLYDNEYKTGSNTAPILDVQSLENFYPVERGVYAEIQSNLSQGNGVTFTISPALPTGLKIDSKTGLISGTPSIRTSSKSYVISATNLIGKSEYILDIEVRDYFRIADSSGSSTAFLHRYGASRTARQCRINATDIIEGTGDLDVRCFMDIEEEELHFTKLDFKTSTGAGVCEFVQVEPYSFNQYAPYKTTTSTHIVVKPACKATDGVVNALGGTSVVTTMPTSASICAGDYSDGVNSGPNCDSGKYRLTVISGADANSNGTCDDALVPGPGNEYSIATTVEVTCGGKASNCVAGPVTDILTDSQIALGMRSVIYQTSAGQSFNNTFSSPIQKVEYSNIRASNSTIANTCNLTNDDADNWESFAAAKTAIQSPFGSENPFYTFNCLDGAKDIKARIRLVVREWNKTFDVNSLLDVDIPGGGTGTAIMNNTTVVFGKSNNDSGDWDNFRTVEANPTACAGSCSNATYTSESTCTAALETWTWMDHGTCSGGGHTDKYTCETDGETWTARGYSFPQSSL